MSDVITELANEANDKTMQIARLRAENAKLRELVMDMCVWAYIDSDCDLEDRFANRMHELGVDE